MMAFSHSLYVGMMLLIVVMAACISYFIQDPYPRLPDSIPWVGIHNELFAKMRARIRVLTQGWQFLLEGYSKYNSIDKPFICPDFAGKAHVFIPRTYIPWLLDQPDDVLDPRPVQIDTFGVNYLHSHAALHNPFHHEVIRRGLTRSLSTTAGPVSDELGAALDEHWGTDTEVFRDVPVFESMKAILARAMSRVFVGQPLCRDPKYLNAIQNFTEVTASQGLAIGLLLPTFLKPIFAPFIALPYHVVARRVNKILIPLFTQRIADQQRAKNDVMFGQKYVEPNDLAQWMLQYGQKYEGSQEWEPARLSERMSMVVFAALHSSAIAATNVMFNLASSPPDKGFLGSIRAEASAVMPEDISTWTKLEISKLIRADSAIRETMRCNGLIVRGLAREVMKKEGVTLPDGLHLARGTRLSAAIVPIHLDERFYPRAEEYNAFRFSDARSSTQEQLEESRNLAPKAQGMSLATTGDTFYAFGRGKYACPGRFFVAQELKALLALISLRYEIKPLAKRPSNITIGGFSVPPLTATLSVRRRKFGEAN